MKKFAYSYITLRYVHDIAAGEFVNVGIVLYSREQHLLKSRFRHTYTRIKKVFPDANGLALKSTLSALESTFDRLSDSISSDLPLEEHPNSIEAIVSKILPKDDSALQWGPRGSGLSTSLDDTLEFLYRRYITFNDDKGATNKRSDEEVWRAFKREFDAKKITSHFTTKTIRSSDDEREFQHAWKNGIWHCIEPVSLDLSSSESIKEKAIRWLGQMETLSDGATEGFKVYFLLGEPSQKNLHEAFEKASRILGKAKCAEVIPESKAKAFSDELSSKVVAHRANRD
jgi:hypothetical protein